MYRVRNKTTITDTNWDQKIDGISYKFHLRIEEDGRVEITNIKVFNDDRYNYKVFLNSPRATFNAKTSKLNWVDKNIKAKKFPKYKDSLEKIISDLLAKDKTPCVLFIPTITIYELYQDGSFVWINRTGDKRYLVNRSKNTFVEYCCRNYEFKVHSRGETNDNEIDQMRIILLNYWMIPDMYFREHGKI